MAVPMRRLIVQVVVNIVDNALKYTPPGSHIAVTAAREGKMVAISIADDGPACHRRWGPGVRYVLQWFQPRRRQPPQSGAGPGAVSFHHHRPRRHDLPFAEPAAWGGIPFYPACRGGAMA